MDNKLVFEPTTLTQYNWNKYQLIENRTYKWDKYEAVPEYLYTYYWNKYEAVPPGLTNRWDVYNVIPSTNIEYDEDVIIQIWEDRSYRNYNHTSWQKNQNIRVLRNSNSILNDIGAKYTFGIADYGPDNDNSAYIRLAKQVRGAYLSLGFGTSSQSISEEGGTTLYLAKTLKDITQKTNLIYFKRDIVNQCSDINEMNTLLSSYIMDGYIYAFTTNKQYFPYGESYYGSHIGYGAYDSYENGLLYGYSFKANDIMYNQYLATHPNADYTYPQNAYLYTSFNHVYEARETTIFSGDIDFDAMSPGMGKGSNSRGLAPLHILNRVFILTPSTAIGYNTTDRDYYIYETDYHSQNTSYNLVITANNTTYTHYTSSTTQPDEWSVGIVYNGHPGNYPIYFYPSYTSEVVSPNINSRPIIGTFNSSVYNTEISTYPQKGLYNNKYYIYIGETTIGDYSPGRLIEEVNSNYNNTYPQNGIQNDYYYIYQYWTREVIRWVKDTYIGTQTSPSFDFPSNSFLPNNFNDEEPHYWYSYLGYTSQYSKGDYQNTLYSYIENAYPLNGYILNDSWYSFVNSEQVIVGQLIIDNSLLMGGVNYTQEINPSEDLQIGTPGAAQIDFTIFAPDASAATQYLGKDFTYYVKMNSDNDWRQIGTFTLTKAELPDKQTAKIQGFDYIYKFDTIIDEWLDEQTFPMTLGDMFASLCEYVGCEAYSTDFTNSDFMVNDNFEAVQITGRTILQYITEASGGFCVAEPDGRIHLKHYAIPPTGAVNLGNNSYRKYTHEIYNVPVISSVVVRKDDDDEGVESNV